jgi:hypothetical protein
MKKILFVAVCATLLAAGCQKTEILNQVAGEALTFSTHMGKLTKASDADSTGVWNLHEQDFKVWAFKAYTDAVNGDAPGDVYDDISAIKVTSDDNGATWGTTTDYYWPGVEKELDFFAVSTGATWSETGISVDIEGEGQTVGSRKLTVNNYVVNNGEPNDDLMVAEFVRQHQGMNDKNVKLHFKHALAKVQFKFYTTAKDEDTVSVNSIHVDSLKTTGTLVVEEADSLYADKTGRAAVKLSWNPADSTAQFTDDKDASITLTSEPAEFATWLVLPQDIIGRTVSINYTINGRTFDQVFALTRDAVTEVKDEQGNVTTPGKEAFVKWNINQVVTYTINLTPNRITFKPSVEKWDDETPQTDVN